MRGPLRTAYTVTELQFAPHDRATFVTEATSKDKFKQARARLMLAAYDAGRPLRSLPYPVQAVRFGDDLTLLALADEVTGGVRPAFEAGVSQGEPDRDGLLQRGLLLHPVAGRARGGGYEPQTSMIYYGLPGPFAENVEETVIAACRKVLKGVGLERKQDER